MSRILYQLAISGYSLLLQGLAPFHAKARKMVAGRQQLLENIAAALAGNQHPVAWFHCASLGEFEQGRPLMEAFARQHPEYRIVLTFFSPSGYEVRKNYSGAHYIFYLPLDSAGNARQFVDLVNPQLAVFVKYEFWFYYLHELHRRQIPVFSVSAIFRPSQLFFKSYGGFYRDLLKLFTHIFTQNAFSAALLKQAGISQVSVAGDTRFDRVLQTAAGVKTIPVVERFKASEPCFIIGSSWPQDLEVLLPFILKWADQVRFIIAPHEIHEKEIGLLQASLAGLSIRYSKASPETAAQYRVLLIDNIGMLSSLYAYGNFGFIGGAFGKGLHNTLEAAVFGLPLFFGPVYDKFQEARDLVEQGLAFPVHTTAELEEKFSILFHSAREQEKICLQAKTYVQSHAGASATILERLKTWLPQL
ncbi:MAG: 3-deoxy-D-manno-octulosonic acid transferase [Adhaeribacter sp.]